MIVRNVREVKEYDVREAYGHPSEGITIRWIMEKRLGGDEYMHHFALRHFTMKPRGYYPPPHSHPWEEVMVITKGKCTVTSGGKTVEAGPEDAIYVPANEDHSFKNPYDETCEFYCIYACIGEGENCLGLGPKP